MPSRRLIAPRYGRAAWAVIVGAVVVLLALATWLHGRGPTAFDDWCSRHLFEHLSTSVDQILVGFSAPQIPIFATAVVVLCACIARRWDLAAFGVVTPAAATVLTEFVGKPVVGRVLGAAGSFPSGHETGVGSAAVVLAVALAQLPLTRRARGSWHTGLVLWVLIAGAGLVSAGYHYVTDVIGAIALSIAVGLVVALLVDRASALQPARGAQAGEAEPTRVR
jgi:membrane-associated phospholipid phosphatase